VVSSVRPRHGHVAIVDPPRAPTLTAALTLDAAEVRIAGRRILGPVSLSVEREQRWAILGPNGSGKTTLLRLAGAMRQPSAGIVHVLGGRLGAVDVRPLRERIAHVGHAVSDLIPRTLAVREVVMSGKRSVLVPWFQTFDDADRARAEELLERFGCAALADHRLADTSQGERQRVLLARALFGRPELLLLDEPAAGLDLGGREDLVSTLSVLAHDPLSPAIVLVSHHVEEIPPGFTHLLLLADGRVVAQGLLEDTLTSANLSAAFGQDLELSRWGDRFAARRRG
jgi:iron complex transport system ATP-binding protein